MKRTSVIWYILGAIVLIALGFVAGYALNGGFTRLAGGPGGMPFNGLRGAAVPGMMAGGMRGGLRFGFGGLVILYFLLGPLCGFLALLLVLTRRPAAAPAQVTAVAAPAAPVETAAPAEPEAPKAASKKK